MKAFSKGVAEVTEEGGYSSKQIFLNRMLSQAPDFKVPKDHLTLRGGNVQGNGKLEAAAGLSFPKSLHP